MTHSLIKVQNVIKVLKSIEKRFKNSTSVYLYFC